MISKITSILGKNIVLSVFCASLGFAPVLFAKNIATCRTSAKDLAKTGLKYSLSISDTEETPQASLRFRKLPGYKNPKLGSLVQFKKSLICNKGKRGHFYCSSKIQLVGSYYVAYSENSLTAKIYHSTLMPAFVPASSLGADPKFKSLSKSHYKRFPKMETLDKEGIGLVPLTTLTCHR